MYFIGVAITLFGLGFACYLRGVLFGNFITPASVIVIFFAMIGIIVSTSSFKLFVRGVNAILSPRYVIEDGERLAAADLFRLLSKSVILTSVIVPFITVMAALSWQEDAAQTAHWLASGIVSPVLGLALVLAVLEPAIYILKKPRAQD